MQAREYLPAYGRFAEPDPAHDQGTDNPQSWDLYGYVTNNPVTGIDPTGMMDLKEAAERLKNALAFQGFKTDLEISEAEISKHGSSGRPIGLINDFGNLQPYDKDVSTSKKSSTGGVSTHNGHTWITPTPDGGDDKGQFVDDGHGHYKGQCVSLVKRQTGAPQTSKFRLGASVQGNSELVPGTAVAAMKNNQDWTEEGHTGFYLRQNERGFYMTDQYITGKHPHAVGESFIPWHSTSSDAFQQQGVNYHVLVTP